MLAKKKTTDMSGSSEAVRQMPTLGASALHGISKWHSAIWQAYHVEVPEELLQISSWENPQWEGFFQHAKGLSTGGESGDLGASRLV